MTQQNLISLSIQQQAINEINSAINVLQTKLLPVLKNLNPEEKAELLKMGDKSVAFVNKSHEYAIANPELVPSFLDLEEFKADVNALAILHSIQSALQQIVDSVTDSKLMAGSDAYKAALMFYDSVKSAKKSNVAKAGTIYDDLSARFPAKKKAKGAE